MGTYELSYDLEAACEENSIPFSDIQEELLEITGENDEFSWHWIVRTDEGFAYITGWCDYTGWDCQSGAERFDASDMLSVLALCPQDIRRVFEDMITKNEKQRPNTGGL